MKRGQPRLEKGFREEKGGNGLRVLFDEKGKVGEVADSCRKTRCLGGTL